MIESEKFEVKFMENEELQQQEPMESTPRPRWQVWLARIALIIFVAFLIMYYSNIFRS